MLTTDIPTTTEVTEVRIFLLSEAMASYLYLDDFAHLYGFESSAAVKGTRS